MSTRPNFHFALFLKQIKPIQANCGATWTEPQDAVEASVMNTKFVLK